MDWLPDFPTISHYLINLVSLWNTAIHAPKSLLSLAPSDQQITDALTFYLEMLAISFVFTAPLILKHKSEFSDKLRMVASVGFAVLSLLLLALVGDLAFRLFGGKGTFATTFMALAYGAGPYGPLMALGSLLIYASLPAKLQPYALAPAAAQKVGQIAFNTPGTNRPLFVTANLITLTVMVVSYVVFLRCLIVVQATRGVRTVAAIVVALIAAGIVNKLVMPIASTIMPAPNEELAEAPAPPATDAAAKAS